MANIGVIGAGYWAQNMLRVIGDCDDARLRWICDSDAKALHGAAGRYAGALTTADFLEVVNDPETDAVYIATPPHTHVKIAKAALEAGKHVLVEKPLSTDSFEALDLIETAARNERTLMAGHTFLYSAPVCKVKALIESGQLGDVFYIDSARVNLGRYQPSGVIWDLAPHDLSIVCYWLDMAPIAVNATAGSYRGTSSEDVAFITLEFPNGALAQIHVSWLAPAKLRRTTISGSKQMVVYDDTAGPEAVRVYDQGVEASNPETFGEFQLTYRRGDVTIPFLEPIEPLRREFQHFLDCAATGKRPLSDGASGFRIVRIIEAVHRAVESGKREEIDWSQRQQTTTKPRERFGVALSSEYSQ